MDKLIVMEQHHHHRKKAADKADGDGDGDGVRFMRSTSYSQGYSQGPSELLVELEGLRLAAVHHWRARMMVKLSHLYAEKARRSHHSIY